MSIKGKIDDINHKKWSDGERKKKKNCTPTDNYGERYVDPMNQEGRYHEAGKGSKNRMPGWYSDETTKRLEEIFGKKKEKKKKTNS